MTDKRIANLHHATFESIRQTDDAGNEYWNARQLAVVLEYSQYRHFLPVIERAKEACRNSGQAIENHIEDILTMVEIGSGALREIPDVRLSRYACYLIVQNGDPSKPVIANGQTYFAIQTRRQELADDAKFSQLNEDEKRLAIRNELAQHNKYLAAAAKEAGVETSRLRHISRSWLSRTLWRFGGKRYSCPQRLEEKPENSGSHGQYRIGCQSVPRYANRREVETRSNHGKGNANQTHFEVGKKVRETIKELGGTMPEALPNPESGIKQIVSAQKKVQKNE